MIIAIFSQVRSLKQAIVPRVDAAGGHFEGGNKRRLYMLIVIALTQPLLIWWLTRHLARGTTVIV